MRITLQQVEAFFWAARLGTFHAAARHLNFTQPAISARIKELESTLGVTLFDRRNQRIELTAFGRNALIYAERLLSAGQELERLQNHGSLRGLLRFGADESSALAGLTGILSQLQSRYPDLQIEVTVDLSSVLRAKINRRELDVAIHTSLGEKPPPHVVEHVLGWKKFQWVASPTMNILAESFSPANAIKLPIVTNAAPSAMNTLVREWLRLDGYEFTAYNAANSLSLMIKLVEAGNAIALLPSASVREQLAARTLKVLVADPPVPLVPFALSYLSEDREGLTAVIDIVHDVLANADYFAVAPSIG
jgi:DNA-binding transcriptional LysR family regulator